MLREDKGLTGYRLSEPLVLEGEFSKSICIERCVLHGIKAEGCEFQKDFRINQTGIQSPVNFNHARFLGRMECVNVDFKDRALFEGAKFSGAVGFTSVCFIDEAVFNSALFEDMCDMEGLEFEQAEFCRVQFKSLANFRYCKFDELVDFTKSEFEGRAVFEDANFDRGADFDSVKFKGTGAFEGARFLKHAFFTNTVFHGVADFDKSKFKQHADFRKSVFHEALEFRHANVESAAHFNYAFFKGRCDFGNSEFAKLACVKARAEKLFNFPDVEIKGATNFKHSIFSEQAKFPRSRFGEDVSWYNARFNQAIFTEVSFGKGVNFHEALFEKKADFRKVSFENGPVCLDSVFTNGAEIKWAQIENKLGNTVKEGHAELREEYRKLTNIFRANSDYDSFDRAWEMFRHHENMADESGSSFLKLMKEIFLRKWTGYGTKPLNVFLTSLGIIILFAFIFSFFEHQFQQPLVGWDSYLYFSLTTFIASGVEGINPVYDGWLKTLIVLEAFLGFLLMTLFTVMLARKLVR